MDILTYALAKNYTDKALLGVGTIKGAPCTVKSQTEDDEYVYVTLGWENNLGTSEETVVKIKKGTDGAPGEPGPAGDPGPQGVSITKIEKIKTEGLIDTYQISFSDNTTFEYTVSNGSDAVIDDNETGLTKTFSSDKISKTFATIEEVNKRIPQYDVLPTPTEAFGGKVVQFIGITTEDYIHNYFYECVQVEGNYKWVNTVVQNVPTKVSELTNDSNFVTETELNKKGYLTEHQDISGKVDKEEGKSLIADSEITRLSTVKNYDDSVVKEDIATIKTDYATKTYVGEQIAAADHLKREIVTEVPTVETAAENVIYMLKIESAIGADKYKEYMLIDGEVACVGDTSVDLTDYAKKSEIPTELPANGGNADTVNMHTVASDVPENAVFTDTVYDDTAVKEDVNTLKKGTTVNLLNPILETTTSNGITCTNNGDGTYTLNGTKTTDTIWLRLGTVSLKANTSYKLIGQSSTDTSIDVRVYDNDGINFGDGTYGGATPIITPTTDLTLSMQIRVAEKTALNNFIVKPMITTNLDATYDDFVPYTGDTGKLNNDVANIKKDISATSQAITTSETNLTTLIDNKTKIADKYVSKPKVLKYTNVGSIGKNDIFTGVSSSTAVYATNDASYTSSYTDAIIIVTDQDLEYLKTTTGATISFGKYISYRSSSGELTEYNCLESEQVIMSQSGELMIYPTGNAIDISGIYPEEFAKYGFPEIDGEITVQDVLNNYVEDKIYMDVAIKGKTVSMLDYNNYKTHYTLNQSTGKEEKTDDNVILMNFLPIAGNLKYLFTDGQTRALFLYDEDKNFLSIKGINPPVYLVKTDFESSNSKAAYFRFEFLYQQNQNSKYQIMPSS
jgi:hypothetical protein